MKKDVHNRNHLIDKWMNQISKKTYVEDALTKQNSKHLINYIIYLKNRDRAKRTLYENKNKMKVIMRLFQNKGFNDITKLKENDVLEFFTEWKEKGHTDDYKKRFKAFWNYWMKINRREGKAVLDIVQDLEIKEKESMFVWVTKEDLNKICKELNYEHEVLARFLFDSIMRFPSEVLNLKVEDVSKNKNGEVWINIPNEISKTFGRKFNLVYSGELLLKYIKEKNLEGEEYLFRDVSYEFFNRKLQEKCKKIWNEEKNEAGEYYKNITGYDFRHSGAIHFRRIFQKTGQSLDSLRHRGGWSDFKMINYYTKLLGLDGHINKDKTLLQEDKTKLEKDMEKMKKKLNQNEKLMEMFKKYVKLDMEQSKNEVLLLKNEKR